MDACYRLRVLRKNAYRQFLDQAAKGGHPEACAATGRLTPGQSVSPDVRNLSRESYREMLSLVRDAKDGNKVAQIKLAEKQISGNDVLRKLEDSTQEPETLYQVAAAEGNVAATQCLLRLRRKAGAGSSNVVRMHNHDRRSS